MDDFKGMDRWQRLALVVWLCGLIATVAVIWMTIGVFWIPIVWIICHYIAVSIRGWPPESEEEDEIPD